MTRAYRILEIVKEKGRKRVSKPQMTLRSLKESTKKLREKQNDPGTVKILKVTPLAGNKTLTVSGEARGTKIYPVTMTFFEVDFNTERDQHHPITATPEVGAVMFMEQIKESQHKVQVRCQCLVGDTLIPLADGYSVKIKDLVGLEEFYVYSYDRDNGSIAIGRGYAARKSGNDSIIKVTFDNGNSVRCTPDHKFLLVNGQYRDAADLKTGDSIKPLYRKPTTGRFKGYEQYFEDGDWFSTHRLSDSCFPEVVGSRAYTEEEEWESSLPPHETYVIHHEDFNKLNNNPCNLTRMDKKDHIVWHSKNMSGDKNPMRESAVVAKMVKTLRANGVYKEHSHRMIMNNPMHDLIAVKKMVNTNIERGNYNGAGYHFRAEDQDVRDKMSKAKKRQITEDTFCYNFGWGESNVSVKRVIEGTHHFLSKDHAKRTSLQQKALVENGNHVFLRPHAEKHKALKTFLDNLSVGDHVLSTKTAENLGYTTLRNLCRGIRRLVQRENLPHFRCKGKIIKKLEPSFSNHTVVGIESDGFEDVYTFTVDKHENFAVDVDNGVDFSSGIFVKNCPDFRFTWAHWDKQESVLSGKAFPQYTRKTATRPERNPNHHPGLCKHLVAFTERLRRDRIIR